MNDLDTWLWLPWLNNTIFASIRKIVRQLCVFNCLKEWTTKSDLIGCNRVGYYQILNWIITGLGQGIFLSFTLTLYMWFIFILFLLERKREFSSKEGNWYASICLHYLRHSIEYLQLKYLFFHKSRLNW